MQPGSCSQVKQKNEKRCMGGKKGKEVRGESSSPLRQLSGSSSWCAAKLVPLLIMCAAKLVPLLMSSSSYGLCILPMRPLATMGSAGEGAGVRGCRQELYVIVALFSIVVLVSSPPLLPPKPLLLQVCCLGRAVGIFFFTFSRSLWDKVVVLRCRGLLRKVGAQQCVVGGSSGCTFTE